MYLIIRGDCFTENVFKEIGALTDRAKLQYKRVEYRQEDKLIVLPIERYNIRETNRLSGLMTPYKIDRSRGIKSSLTIRKVVACTIENNIDDHDISDVTILFGLQVKGKEMYVSSAEESKGVPCYAITLKVSGIDLEIRDDDEEGK